MQVKSQCEDTISSLIQNGAITILEKEAVSGTLLCKTVILQKENCQIKFGYLNLGKRQILVEHLCRCNKKNNWSQIPKNCLSI